MPGSELDISSVRPLVFSENSAIFWNESSGLLKTRISSCYHVMEFLKNVQSAHISLLAVVKAVALDGAILSKMERYPNHITYIISFRSVNTHKWLKRWSLQADGLQLH